MLYINEASGKNMMLTTGATLRIVAEHLGYQYEERVRGTVYTRFSHPDKKGTFLYLSYTGGVKTGPNFRLARRNMKMRAYLFSHADKALALHQGAISQRGPSKGVIVPPEGKKLTERQRIVLALSRRGYIRRTEPPTEFGYIVFKPPNGEPPYIFVGSKGSVLVGSNAIDAVRSLDLRRKLMKESEYKVRGRKPKSEPVPIDATPPLFPPADTQALAQQIAALTETVAALQAALIAQTAQAGADDAGDKPSQETIN